jgi:molybdopterin synthase sulfur carrier subunit
LADVKVVYFAWVRERMGRASETVGVPADITTAGAFVDWLATVSEQHAYALERPEVIRIALDQVHADRDEPLGETREVALFPPMTGG